MEYLNLFPFLQKQPSTVSGPMFVKHTSSEDQLIAARGKPIFGFPLQQALEDDREIPYLAEAAINFILANGLQKFKFPFFSFVL